MYWLHYKISYILLLYELLESTLYSLSNDHYGMDILRYAFMEVVEIVTILSFRKLNDHSNTQINVSPVIVRI